MNQIIKKLIPYQRIKPSKENFLLTPMSAMKALIPASIAIKVKFMMLCR